MGKTPNLIGTFGNRPTSIANSILQFSDPLTFVMRRLPDKREKQLLLKRDTLNDAFLCNVSQIPVLDRSMLTKVSNVNEFKASIENVFMFQVTLKKKNPMFRTPCIYNNVWKQIHGNA